MEETGKNKLFEWTDKRLKIKVLQDAKRNTAGEKKTAIYVL